MSKVKVVVKVNVCVVASGFARWSMSVCVWLHLASPDVSVDSADGASIVVMSLTTRIHSSKQARQVKIKDLKRIALSHFNN